MSVPSRIVLDANILLRSVLGKKVRPLLERHADAVELYSPAICFHDAERHVAAVLAKSGRKAHATVWQDLEKLVLPVESRYYALFEQESHLRIARRDPKDWHVIATALLLDAPIWTEDQDFFGAGVATWSTCNIELFFERALSAE